MSFQEIIQHWVQHCNPKRYWKYYFILSNKQCKKSFINYLRLLYIKKQDAFGKSSFGIDVGEGAKFDSIPTLIHPKVELGKKVLIAQQITTGHSFSSNKEELGFPRIGNMFLLEQGQRFSGV